MCYADLTFYTFLYYATRNSEVMKKCVFASVAACVRASNLRDLTAAKLPHPGGDTDYVLTKTKINQVLAFASSGRNTGAHSGGPP